MKTIEIAHIKEKLIQIFARNYAPEVDIMLPLVKDVWEILLHENSTIRPYGENNKPGGLIYINPHIDTIIVPDIHARIDFMLSLLLYETEQGSIVERLYNNTIQVVCIGDGMHAESRAAKRWMAAKKEYKKKFKRHDYMDIEMKESFCVMEMVLELKRAFPHNFHYLKGNHDNIANERGKGNYPFMKFAFEGPMVTEYVFKFYGLEFLKYYYAFEKALPLFAINRHFLISHAEPAFFYTPFEIINYKKYPEVITGLTWTDDEESITGSVEAMIREYIDPIHQNTAFYFGGHRAISGLYNKRANDRYIQIHNPYKFIIALIPNERPPILQEDIIEINNITKNIHGAKHHG